MNITEYKSYLLGLLGHVDCGKTAIAKLISEIISTSGLDAHPQSKKRGITIDLGFTSLIMGDSLISLVDAPGHADLIKSVVASANIINGGIVVIDAKEGFQIQTAEHLVILESLDITDIIIVVNKIDLVSEERLRKLDKEIEKIMMSSKFGRNVPIAHVSAKTGEGKDDLMAKLGILVKQIENKRKRIDSDHLEHPKHPEHPEHPRHIKNSENVIYLIDHHFKIKGSGIVVTGTLQQGEMFVGQQLTVIPYNTPVKIKSLQVFHQNVDRISKGYRVGTSIIGIEDNLLYRGCILCSQPSEFKKIELIEVLVEQNSYFKKTVRFGAQINVTFGLLTVNARIFPFLEFINRSNKIRLKCDLIPVNKNNQTSSNAGREKQSSDYRASGLNSNLNLMVDNDIPENAQLKAYIWFNEPIFIRKDERLLLSRLDLPPNSLRFFGIAQILQMLDSATPPVYNTFKIKEGKIKSIDYGKDSVLIEGLAQSKKGAETLIGKTLEPPFGKILSTFGSKGVVVVKINENYKKEFEKIKTAIKKELENREQSKDALQKKESSIINELMPERFRVILKIPREFKILKDKTYS